MDQVNNKLFCGNYMLNKWNVRWGKASEMYIAIEFVNGFQKMDTDVIQMICGAPPRYLDLKNIFFFYFNTPTQKYTEMN